MIHNSCPFRFNAVNDRDKDRSGNAPAGLVVDRDIVHPIEFDFYLQSQGGLLGTSRSSHYSVLYDDNKFKYVHCWLDTVLLLNLSSQCRRDAGPGLFSVSCLRPCNPFGVNPCTCLLYVTSIPAIVLFKTKIIPISDADIVCARAKHHYAPGASGLSDSATNTSAQAMTTLEDYRTRFQPLSAYATRNMYFSVSFLHPYLLILANIHVLLSDGVLALQGLRP